MQHGVKQLQNKQQHIFNYKENRKEASCKNQPRKETTQHIPNNAYLVPAKLGQGPSQISVKSTQTLISTGMRILKERLKRLQEAAQRTCSDKECK